MAETSILDKRPHDVAGGGSRVADPALIAISANSAWNIVNFRSGLVKSLQDQGHRVVAIVPPSADIEDLERLSVDIELLPMNARGLSPFGDALLLSRYIAVLARLRPAAFLGFTAKPNIYGGIAARLVGVPVISNVTGLGTGFLSGRALERVLTSLYRFALRGSKSVFFHNLDDLQLFVERRIVSPAQAQVIPGSGVDLERFAARPPPQGQRLTFLFIGRMLKDKGIVEFGQAARLVRSSIPEARFVALGEWAEHPKAAPRERLDQWRAEGLIEFAGATADVRPFIEAADCIVLPSYREGLPRVLLEAAAMARPAIATDVPGCREVIDDGVTGYLCKCGSSSSLAEAMRALAALSAEQRAEMGRLARRKAENQFSEERVTSAYVSALAALAR